MSRLVWPQAPLDRLVEDLGVAGRLTSLVSSENGAFSSLVLVFVRIGSVEVGEAMSKRCRRKGRGRLHSYQSNYCAEIEQ